MMDRKDKAVISAFVAHLAANGHDGLAVSSWPDEDEHRTGKATQEAIDAIAGEFAIEHTSIDTLEGQREADAPFMKSLGLLETEVTVPFHLNIFVRWGTIAKGQNYAATREAVGRWILAETPGLPCGRHEVEHIPGVPFGLVVWKREGMGDGVFVGRSVNSDETLGRRMNAAIERKVSKLKHWSKHTRVLLIESDDIALMNDRVFLEALREACPDGLPEGVDQIWYADTSARPAHFVNFTSELTSYQQVGAR